MKITYITARLVTAYSEVMLVLIGVQLCSNFFCGCLFKFTTGVWKWAQCFKMQCRFLYLIKQALYGAITDVILLFPVIFQLRHRSTCPSSKSTQSNPGMIDSFTLHL